jgi:hypothetical protein
MTEARAYFLDSQLRIDLFFRAIDASQKQQILTSMSPTARRGNTGFENPLMPLIGHTFLASLGLQNSIASAL